MLPKRRFKVPHLSLDRLSKLENSAGQKRPIFPQDNFEESARNSARVRDDVVHVRLEGEGGDAAARDVSLQQDVHLAVNVFGAAGNLKKNRFVLSNFFMYD